MSVRPNLWQASRFFALRLPVWVIVLLLSGLALLPRVSGLNDFYTTDEAYFWQARVDRFSDALSMGDWAATNQTGHPGVTTMWLGSFGQRFAEMRGVPAATQGGGALFLAYLRTPLALVNGLAVGLGYVLLRRLLPPRTALLAALLWATSPFLIAHSRLLHLDALLTSFTTLSLLSLCVATAPGSQRLLPLVVAGGCGGLALLTKAPALLLLPVTGLLLFIAGVRGKALTRQVVLAALGRASVRFALWLAIAAMTFVALWPAMWVQPVASLGAVVAEVFSNGTQPHNAGNFFLGQPVADPGWAFYLAVIAWRGEAVTLVGLAALLISTGAALRRSAAASVAQEQWVTAALTLFAVLFTLALTLLAKKFDRYLLPIWPVLQILGAVGYHKTCQVRAQAHLRGYKSVRYAHLTGLRTARAHLRGYKSVRYAHLTDSTLRRPWGQVFSSARAATPPFGDLSGARNGRSRTHATPPASAHLTGLAGAVRPHRIVSMHPRDFRWPACQKNRGGLLHKVLREGCAFLCCPMRLALDQCSQVMQWGVIAPGNHRRQISICCLKGDDAPLNGQHQTAD